LKLGQMMSIQVGVYMLYVVRFLGITLGFLI